jgi:hypothetical protein
METPSRRIFNKNGERELNLHNVTNGTADEVVSPSGSAGPFAALKFGAELGHQVPIKTLASIDIVRLTCDETSSFR